MLNFTFASRTSLWRIFFLSDLLYFFAQISPRLPWKLSIDREKNCKTSQLVCNDVSCLRTEWCYHALPTVDKWPSCQQPMLCHSPLMRWMCLMRGLSCIWSSERGGQWSPGGVMKPGQYGPTTASSVSPGILTPCALHPVSTRCITTL